MEYRQFGRTGLFVSLLAFGTGGFGKARMGNDIGQHDADRMVGMALDSGVNLFDTSDVYGEGESEVMLGKALGPRRKDVVISTKAHARTGLGPNDVGQSRVHLMHAIENSLRKLRTDWIDLYQMHQFDPLTPFEESLRTFDDAIRQGKIRYIGASNLMAWQIMKASKIATQHGWEEFVSVQAYYSAAGRDIERELVPLVLDQKIALLAFSPLSGGFLSGDITREHKPRPGTRRSRIEFPPVDLERGYNLIQVLLDIAARRGTTVPRVALAWLICQPHLTSAIIGADNAEQLQDDLGAVGVSLAPDELAAIDAASRLPREYPSWATDLSASRVPLKFEGKGNAG